MFSCAGLSLHLYCTAAADVLIMLYGGPTNLAWPVSAHFNWISKLAKRNRFYYLPIGDKDFLPSTALVLSLVLISKRHVGQFSCSSFHECPLLEIHGAHRIFLLQCWKLGHANRSD